MHSYLHGHPALQLAIQGLERLKPDQFELYFEKRASTKIDAKDNQVDSLSRSEDVGVSVRLVRDRRMGFSYTTSLEKSAIERAVQAAWDVAAQMPEDENASLYNFGSAVYPNVDQFDHKGVAAPLDRKVALAKRLEAACRKQDPRIRAIRAASVAESVYEVHLVDSNGDHIQSQATRYTASVTAKAEQDGEAQMGGDFGFSADLDRLESEVVDAVGKQAALYAVELLGAGPCPSFQAPAILRNSVVAELIEFLASSFSAEEIAKGRSMLAGKLGERLFSEHVTLIDDGLLAGGFSTSPFDGEGVPSSATTLVDGGIAAAALYDVYYGRKEGKDPTGSAQRGIKAPPSIGFSNLYLKKGKKTPAKLLDGISRGILITDLMGVHTANPVTGEFSLGASGLLIENGKVTRPVRGFAVAGNVLEVFRRMTDIGNDLRFFGNVGAPSVRVSELAVSGT